MCRRRRPVEMSADGRKHKAKNDLKNNYSTARELKLPSLGVYLILSVLLFQFHYILCNNIPMLVCCSYAPCSSAVRTQCLHNIVIHYMHGVCECVFVFVCTAILFSSTRIMEFLYMYHIPICVNNYKYIGIVPCAWQEHFIMGWCCRTFCVCKESVCICTTC